jgi:phosphonate transport system substrate-binding protein
MRILTKCIYIFLAFVGFAAQSISWAAEQDPKPLVLAVHPYLPFQALQRRFQPLADYLETYLDQPVVVRIGPDYAEHIGFIGQNKVDIAYLGPANYVRMVEKYGEKPLLARLEINGKPRFHGYLVTTEETGISDLASLRGKSFAFGDPVSTMSHLVPRYMLLEAGIDVRDLVDYQFLGSHKNVAIAVLSGAFDAGAVKEEVWKDYQHRGLRVIAKTEPFSEHLFVTRANASGEFVNTLRKALFRLSETARGRAILQGIKQGATGLVPVHDKDYDNLRGVLKILQSHGVE